MFNDERSEAYKLVRGYFVTIREQSAHDLDTYEASQNEFAIPISPEELDAIESRRDASRRAIKHLREVHLVSALDLSSAAYCLVKDFLDWLDGEEHSDGDGTFYEWNYISTRFLLDFTERRQVDLGAMWSVTWRCRRARRSITTKFAVWRSQAASWRLSRQLRRKRRDKQRARRFGP